MKKNLSFRVAFVVLLVLFGVAAEYFFYSGVQKKAVTGKKSILIVGGSIARGVRSELQSLLDEKFPDAYTVNEFISVGNHMGDILEAYPALLETKRPETVFLLTGLDVFDFSHITKGSEYKELVTISRKPGEALTSEILHRLKTRFQHKDCASLLQLGIVSTMLDKQNHRIDSKMIVDEIETLAQTSLFMEEKSCALNILSFGNFMRAKHGAVLGMEGMGSLRPYQGNPEQLDLFIKNLHQLMKEGPMELKTMGHEKYLKSGSHFGILDRAWLALQVKRKVPLKLANQNHFSFHPYFNIVKNFSMVKDEPAQGSDHWEVLRLVDATQTLPSDVTEENLVPEDFRDRVKRIKSLTDKTHAEMILLQPPNCTKNFIKWIGRDLRVKVIDGRMPFENVITRTNYFTYFVDKVEGSGHMTPLGARVYAKGIMDQTFPRSSRMGQSALSSP